MVIGRLIDVVNQTRQRGALSRTSRARNQKQPSRTHDHFFGDRRNAKLLGSEHLVWNLSQHHRHGISLLEYAHSETGHVTEGKAKVGTPFFGQFSLAAFGSDRFHQTVCIVGGQHFGVLRLHMPVDTKDRRQACCNVNVAHTIFHSGH